MTFTNTLRKTASMGVAVLALYTGYIMASSLYEFVLFSDPFSLSMALSAGLFFGVLMTVAYVTHPTETASAN